MNNSVKVPGDNSVSWKEMLYSQLCNSDQCYRGRRHSGRNCQSCEVWGHIPLVRCPTVVPGELQFRLIFIENSLHFYRGVIRGCCHQVKLYLYPSDSTIVSRHILDLMRLIYKGLIIHTELTCSPVSMDQTPTLESSYPVTRYSSLKSTADTRSPWACKT